MPWTPLTGLPASGERWPAPWICGIVSGSSTGGGSVGPHVTVAVLLFCGDGGALAKSTALLSVSAHALVRVEEVVFEVPGAGAPS